MLRVWQGDAAISAPHRATEFGSSCARASDRSRPGEWFSAFLHLWAPGIVFVLLVCLFEFTDLDLRLSDAFFDFQRDVFPWRTAWWAKDLIHAGGRLLVIALVLLTVSVVLLSCFKAGRRLVRYRRAFLFFALSVAVGTGAVAGLKLVISRPYPEHVQRYGGRTPYTKLFQGMPSGARRTAGFPASHAATGYSLMALYFVFRERSRRMARLGLALGLALGTLFGFGQQVRGMHFASHNVWSAAICWYGPLLLFFWPFRCRVNPVRAAVAFPSPTERPSGTE
jgi:membrane-associated PAP2 superfamily phosphatase